MCKIMISPGIFLIFFLILIFQAAMGVKEKKIVENEKQKLHSHAPYLRSSIGYGHDFW